MTINKHWYNGSEMSKEVPDYTQPVAYDAEGQPLYAHPPKKEVEQQFVHVTRSTEPVKLKVSKEVRDRHEQSLVRYPDLNLSEAEYMIMAVRRHPIAIVLPFTIGALLLGMALSFLFNYDLVIIALNLEGTLANPSVAILPVLLFSTLVIIGLYVVYFVYNNNRFFLTNESVIQRIQYSLFAFQEQTISLGEVEDVNYSQKGILQLLLNYGTIRLSTLGDEHTYQFPFVAHPKKHCATLNNAVEAYKNGRTVSGL
jgi:uncharacterized membrane protein YdbT with pleckstrin-like domain